MFKELNFIWRHLPEFIDPIALRIGPLEIRWYGIMYMLSFLVSYGLILYRLNKEKIDISKRLIDEYFFLMVIAILIGARLGYVLFYNLDYYIRNPLEIILPFDFKEGVRFVGISGMSYHGGLIGLVLGTLIFCYKNKVDFWALADLVSLSVPLGYTLGRIGNFLNLELYGRPTSFFLGMYFPSDPLNKLRHPSQLYEALFEGIVLFLILLFIYKRAKKIKGIVFCSYLLGYGFLRFMVEYFRQPDPQLGFVIGNLTMGQIFCLFMVLIGIILVIIRYKKFYGYLNIK